MHPSISKLGRRTGVASLLIATALTGAVLNAPAASAAETLPNVYCYKDANPDRNPLRNHLTNITFTPTANSLTFHGMEERWNSAEGRYVEGTDWGTIKRPMTRQTFDNLKAAPQQTCRVLASNFPYQAAG